MGIPFRSSVTLFNPSARRRHVTFNHCELAGVGGNFAPSILVAGTRVPSIIMAEICPNDLLYFNDQKLRYYSFWIGGQEALLVVFDDLDLDDTMSILEVIY